MATSRHPSKITGGERVAPRPKMPMSERAKIFIPFEPLKGYRDALRVREEQARGAYGSPYGLPEDEDPNEGIVPSDEVG